MTLAFTIRTPRFAHAVVFLTVMSSVAIAQTRVPSRKSTTATKAPATKTNSAQAPSAAKEDPVAADTKAIEKHFDAAETFQLAGDLDKAAVEYRQGISAALERVGNLKVADGDYNAGSELLGQAVAADPSNLNAAVDLGIAFFRTGDYEKAKACVNDVLKVDSSNFRARNLLGKIHFMQGDFQGAADELQAALAINQDFDVAYSLALANLQLKKLPQATVLFDEMRTALGKTPEMHVLLGQAYRQTGYLDLAVPEFKAALTLNPKYPHAHAYLGMTYVTLGGERNYDLANEQLRLELANAPNDYLSHYFLGVIALDRHKNADAEASLHEAHRIRPDDPGPLLLLGRLYNEQKKWTAAIEVLKQGIAMASSAALPESQLALAHEMLSTAYAGAGNTADAATEAALAKTAQTSAKKANEPASTTATLAAASSGGTQELRSMLLDGGRKPGAPDASEARYVSALSKLLGNAYHNLGVMDARAGKYEPAAEEFKQAGRWDDSIPQLDQNWAVAAFRAQQFADAISPLERLLKRVPNDQKVREMLAISYYMTNNFAASAATFRPIANSLPDNPGLLMSAGIAFVKAGDAATGERMFSRVLAVGGNTPEVHLMLGQAYAEQKDSRQALTEFTRALELNPKLPEAHYFSGMVLFKMGEIEQAAQHLQSELSLNPQYAPAMYQLAYIRLEQHQAAEAVRLLQDVIKQQPDDPEAHYQLGKALLEQEDVPGATRELERSVQLHPTDYAYFQLSRAYTRAGRTSDADEALRNYEKLKPKPKTGNSGGQ